MAGWRDALLLDEEKESKAESWRDAPEVSWRDAPEIPEVEALGPTATEISDEKERVLGIARGALGEAPFPTIRGGVLAGGARLLSGVARVTGQDEKADFWSRYSGALLQVVGERAEEPGRVVAPIVKRGLAGALATGPTMAVTAPLGPYGMIAGGALSEADSAITEGRDAGLRGKKLAAYSARQGVIEGTIAGVMQKVGLGGMEKIVGGKAAISNGIRQTLKQGKTLRGAAKGAVKDFAQEEVEEVTTSVLQTLNTKYSGVSEEEITLKSLASVAAETTSQVAWTMLGVSVPNIASQVTEGRRAKAEQDIVATAESGKAPSRKQWTELGLPAEEGKSKEARLQGIQKIAEQIKAIAEPSEAEFKPAEIISPETMPPEQRSAFEFMRNVIQKGKEAKAVPEAAPVVYRTEEEGVESQLPSAKPQGLYVAPEGSHLAEEPFPEGVKGARKAYSFSPKNPLAVDKEATIPVSERGYLFSRDMGSVLPSKGSVGIQSARQLLGEEKFNLLRKKDKKDLREWIEKEYPDVDWKRYYDNYERIEAVAGIEGRKAGYDALIAQDEYVALSDDVLKAIAEPEVQLAVPEVKSPAELKAKLKVPDGGFTYQPVTKAEPSGGYGVSIFPGREKIIKASEITEKDISDYVKKNKDVFEESPENFLGGWHDPATGDVYLDISHVVPTQEEAVALGRKHNQKAIFDFQTFQSVPIEAPKAQLTKEEFQADFRENSKPAIRFKSGEIVEAGNKETHAEAFTKAQEQGLEVDDTVEPGWTYKDKFVSKDELLAGRSPRGQGLISENVQGVTVGGKFPESIVPAAFTTPPGEVQQFIKGPEGKIGISVKALSKGIGFTKHAMQRFLTSRGELPQSVFNEKVRRDGIMSRIQRDMAYKIKDYDRAIKKAYPGRELTQQEVQAYDGALKGEVPLESLPENMREPVGIMRNSIDALSRRAIDIGAISGRLEGTVIENMGIYINRSYRVHDDPKWADKVPADVRNKAKALLRQEYPGRTEEEVQGLIEKLLYEGTAAESPIAAIKEAMLGSKDLSILTRRKDIPREIRALLGEYRDPRLNYAKTMTKLGNLIANHQFLTQVRELGMGNFFSEVPIVNDKGELKTRITADESSAMYPLNGLYTTPEIKDAFIRATEKGGGMPGWVRFALAANAIVKLNKTVFSLMTHVRNFVANAGFAVMNGHWRAGNMPGSFKAVVTNLGKLNNAEFRGYYLRAVELGIVGQDVHAGELQDHIRDASKKDLNEFAYDLEKRRAYKTKSAIKAVTGTVADLYIAEDDVWKLYAWENEKARYSQAMPELSHIEIEERCAEIVSNTYPTYSRVPESIKALRRFPLMGAFVSFPAEVVRTAYNTVDLAQQELRDPRLRKIGAERAVGSMIAMTTASGIAVVTRMLFGISKDDDDDMRHFVPPWQKNSEFAHLGRTKAGNIRYVDLAYSDPHNTLITPVKAFLEGRDIKEGVWDAMKDIAAPFAGEDILFGKFVDVWSNNDAGRKIYNPQDNINSQTVDVTTHLWSAFEPGTLTSVRRIVKGVTGTKTVTGQTYNPKIETMAVATGQRIQELDIAQSLQWRARDFAREIRDADSILSRTLTNRGHISDKELRSAYERADTARRGLWRNISETAQAAVRLGVPFEEVATTLISGGVPRLDIRGVMGGVYNKRRITTTQLKAMHQANPAEYQGRHDLLVNLLSESGE